MPSPLSPLDANLIRCDDWPNESDNLIRRAVNESDKVTKPPPPPSTPTPPPPTPSATPPTAMATTSSLAGRSEAALFGGGQAAFIAIQCLDVSVASLGSWAALAAVVSASLTSLLSKRAPGPPPSISEFDVAPAVARAVKILNLAAALLHRVRSGDAALTLRLGLSLWLGAHLLRPFSLFTLAWAAFTVAAGLPLVPNHREKVDEARAAAAAAVITWAALARAKVSAVTGDMPQAKYAAALAALTIWYRLSWTSMGLATLFGGLAVKLHLSSEEDLAFSQTLASVVAGAQRKARRMTMTAQSLGLFSPSKERSE